MLIFGKFVFLIYSFKIYDIVIDLLKKNNKVYLKREFRTDLVFFYCNLFFLKLLFCIIFWNVKNIILVKNS